MPEPDDVRSNCDEWGRAGGLGHEGWGRAAGVGGFAVRTTHAGC